MPFPTIQQYRSVLTLPSGSRPFKSPELDAVNAGEVIPPSSPLFLHWGSGSFAAVFRCRELSGQEVALRCLLGPPPPDVAERYQALENHLRNLAHPVSSLVRAQYFADAIKVQGAWLPLFVMDWIEGETLGTHVEGLARRHDKQALQQLAHLWRQLVFALQDEEIAHGDLQHGNVMVTASGELRLVDYDTIFVPSLATKASTAIGTPGYVHCSYLQRGGRPYDALMDTFGALVILLSLVALANDPDLYERFSQDNLLLSEADLLDPAGSDAFKTLLASGEPLIPFLTELLQRMCGNAQVAQVSLRKALEGAPEPATPYSKLRLPLTSFSEVNAEASFEFTDVWHDTHAARRVSVRLFGTACCVAILIVLLMLALGNHLGR